jgi:hypothetical protein
MVIPHDAGSRLRTIEGRRAADRYIDVLDHMSRISRRITRRVSNKPAEAGTTGDRLVPSRRPVFVLVRACLLWWPGAGSNRRPSDFQSDARTN